MEIARVHIYMLHRPEVPPWLVWLGGRLQNTKLLAHTATLTEAETHLLHFFVLAHVIKYCAMPVRTTKKH